MPRAIIQTQLANHIQPLYNKMDVPFSDDPDYGTCYADELLATQYIWQKGSYRCGITAHIIFFMLGDFVEIGGNAKPLRFGKLFNFAKSFDFTDIFIKRVTASGRGKAKGDGLKSRQVRKLLNAMRHMHDKIAIPHWMMTYFGYMLMEQLEYDLPELDEKTKQLHLQYIARMHWIMGLPFSTDRAVMTEYARAIEKKYLRYSELTEPYTRDLLFLGLTVGVRVNEAYLSETLPEPIKSVFKERYHELKPRLHMIILGTVGNWLYWPFRRFRNPKPKQRPQYIGSS